MNKTARDENAHEAHSLKCLEIYGGTQAIDDYVSVPGLDVHVYCRPYQDDEGGGDIHYISTCAAGQISRTVLADVSGHGGAVNDLATALRTLMRKHINTPDLSRFSRALNREFSERADAGIFATAILATYFAPTDHLILCNAGHPPPLWYHAEDRTWRYLTPDDPRTVHESAKPDALNLPLGIIEPTTYEQFAVRLARADVVLLYSDALLEARNDADAQLGDQGLLDLVQALDVDRPESIGPTLLRRIHDHAGAGALDDDATLIVMHHNAADPPPLTLKQRAEVFGRMIGLVGA